LLFDRVSSTASPCTDCLTGGSSFANTGEVSFSRAERPGFQLTYYPKGTAVHSPLIKLQI
jgi:hypothetical protein